MKILFLSRWFPHPMNNGSKIRINNLLRGLSQYHNVTLLSFADQPGVNPEAPEIREVCAKVQVIPWREFDPSTTRARLGFLSIKPRSVVDTFSPEMAEAITATLQEEEYDLVIASQLQMAAYFPYFQNTPALFEEIEIGLFHDQAFSSDGKVRFRQALTWFKLRTYLFRLLGFFHACTVASERERDLILQKFPGYRKPVVVIPNCVNIDEYEYIKPGNNDHTLIFTGPFKYRVNYEAMAWFIGEVFPLILNRIPDAQLIITGDHANLTLPSLQNVTQTGFVDDVKPLIASSSVSIAPLLSGGGTRLKILEAMALGTPVVSTSKGAEGLDARHGEHFLRADAPTEFAECVIKLLKDQALRLRLSDNARRLVQEKYNWAGALSDYSRLVQSIV